MKVKFEHFQTNFMKIIRKEIFKNKSGLREAINTKPVSSNLKSDNSQNKLDLDSKYKFGENISSNLINQNAINFFAS